MSGRILVIAVVVAIAVGGGIATSVRFRDRAPVISESAASSPSSRESDVQRPSASAAAPSSETATASRHTPRKPAASPVTEALPSAVTTPELGTLRIEADVPNAQVFLDRQFIGNAPVTAEKVKPGTHTLNVSAEGFDGVVQTIDVEPGPRDVAVRFKEVRLNATLAVIHKHRVGACRGHLVATPQGIRYDTDDKDDRFTAALSDLEQFVVDYLDKNLKITVRKGKQYNFTDPDGNADRLFVFQRDVDKVRQRLAKGEAGASP
ncbi:MAG TPA: PEGA domain-containing protein [Vicinamibacterales bacterium]|nr:PEGA domain-containing protein [Vicinamibacterales bacterium]